MRLRGEDRSSFATEARNRRIVTSCGGVDLNVKRDERPRAFGAEFNGDLLLLLKFNDRLVESDAVG